MKKDIDKIMSSTLSTYFIILDCVYHLFFILYSFFILHEVFTTHEAMHNGKDSQSSHTSRTQLVG